MCIFHNSKIANHIAIYPSLKTTAHRGQFHSTNPNSPAQPAVIRVPHERLVDGTLAAALDPIARKTVSEVFLRFCRRVRLHTARYPTTTLHTLFRPFTFHKTPQRRETSLICKEDDVPVNSRRRQKTIAMEELREGAKGFLGAERLQGGGCLRGFTEVFGKNSPPP